MEFLLDIIVPHYKEPWEKVKPFFSMLNTQREVDFGLFRVTVVHDGEEHCFPEEYFMECPYAFRQVSIPHAGVSTARNTGLRLATADWVMFCDCDDMFAHPFALMDVMHVLNDSKADRLSIITGDFLAEYGPKHPKHGYVIQQDPNDTVFIHAKFFKRSFLIENGIRFDPELSFGEDTLFIATAYLFSGESGRGQIISKLPTYIWCDTEGSVTNTEATKRIAPKATFIRNRKVCELYKQKRAHYDYCRMVARTVIDAYYYLNQTNLTDDLKEVIDDFYIWFKAHEEEWKSVPYDYLKIIKEKSQKSVFIGTEHLAKDISVTRWLKNLENERSAVA